jgi:predicted methyltransferase
MRNKKLLATTVALFLIASCDSANNNLDEVLNSDLRVESSERDKFRSPKETLSFFGLKANQTVVELSPGGGWYTEILAPYLKDNGKLIAAHHNPSKGDYYKRSRERFDTKMAANAIYDKVEVVDLLGVYGENGSADLVMTFRNLHNWIGGEDVDKVLAESFKVLKSGGMLGVVDHRAEPGTSLEDMRSSGYMTEVYAIELIEAAGFKLVNTSEVNANVKDTKDHERGVWTLPPSLRLGAKDREKYVAIGESDRFTLLFQKP